MAKSKRIIPEFMLDNPDDSFMFLMPLDLKPDDENIANSHFRIAVKNLTKNEHFTTLISPEIFFTHYKLYRAYKAAKLDKKDNKKLEIRKNMYKIDTGSFKNKYDIPLDKCLEKDMIGQLLGYKHTYMKEAQKTSCFLIATKHMNIIIPHSAIAIYYYYRSTVLREATLRCDLDDLYYGYDCNPDDAYIIIPKYIPENDAPFIHRFLCQDDASKNFDRIGNHINAFMRREKDNKKKDNKYIIKPTPIKATYPKEGKFTITAMYSSFYNKDTDKHYQYIHEILDDDSDIGFSKFTTFIQGKKIITDPDDIDKLPTIPIKEPSGTNERLKSEHASKRYKHNSVTSNRKNKCSSLKNIDISSDKITDEDVLEKLKILEETLSDEEVEQSLTDSSGSGKKKIRKTRVSTKGQEFQKIRTKEYTHNFDEFNQYIEYMRTQKVIENLQVYDNQKMITVFNGENGKPNSKCMIYGRERQYITATFKYKGKYIGLLELENVASSSTWMIISKNTVNDGVFDKFLNHYVNEDEAINYIKDMHKGNVSIRFKTKNHERSSVLVKDSIVKWLAGLLSKCIL